MKNSLKSIILFVSLSILPATTATNVETLEEFKTNGFSEGKILELVGDGIELIPSDLS
jgi:hypothetical protein